LAGFAEAGAAIARKFYTATVGIFRISSASAGEIDEIGIVLVFAGGAS
jgi:hypothetical protein